MKDPYLLHIFSPTKYVSPFDINMAYEAHYDAVIPYCNVTLDEIHALTQDTIFSRSPDGVRRTGIFIGGREFDLAIDMLEAARKAMVPPFAVSVLADPSGAITTAAAMVAIAESLLARSFDSDMKGRSVYILGGTGPVGAVQFAVEASGYRRGGGSPEALGRILDDAEVIFNTAKAGVRVVSSEALARARKLAVAVDANAVPPAGIEGIKLKDNGVPVPTGGTCLGVGALAVGDVKYRVHTGLLTRMYEASEPLYLAFDEAFAMARGIVKAGRQ